MVMMVLEKDGIVGCVWGRICGNCWLVGVTTEGNWCEFGSKCEKVFFNIKKPVCWLVVEWI